MKNRVQRKLLESAARTATTSSDTFTDYFAFGVRLILNVTDASGDGGLTVLVDALDSFNDDAAVSINTGGTAITAAGTYAYDIYPNAASAAGNIKDAASRQLPVRWRARVKHADSSSYTYSLTAEVF